MQDNNIFFSIIVPTYNRAALISGTLQSILNQTYRNFEVIVVDDGSKDNTADVVLEFNDIRIKYFKKENGERGAARNYGIQKAKGKYLTFIDSDDVFYKHHLDTAYQFLSREDNIYCYAQAYEIKNIYNNTVLLKGYSSPHPTINKAITKGNFLSCFGVFVKNEVLEGHQFEEDRRFAGTEDWLLWLRLAARYTFYFNNDVTGAMLEHDSRSVLSFEEDSLIYRTETLRDQLLCDQKFIGAFGEKSIKDIYAHMLTYTSLHLAMSRKKMRAVTYWLKALRYNFAELFTRRSLAIIKKILFW